MPKVFQAKEEEGGRKPREFNGRVIPLLSCKKLILTHHYSKRLPSAVKLCFGDVDNGPPRVTEACCIFSQATGRWEYDLWEITRLVRIPEYQHPLSKLVSKAIGHIRSQRLVDLIVSFADAEEDHHGGVYQSCSWLYDGMRGERLDGFNIDGNFVPARTCNALYGTSSVVDLPKKLKGQTVEPHFDTGKHCYWKSLTKQGMQKALRMGLKSVPYPKPMLDSEEGVNYSVEAHKRKGVVQLPDYKRDQQGKATKIDGGRKLT